MPLQAMLLEGLLHEYDGVNHLECDGFSRVASYVLKINGISHTVYEGQCVVGDKIVQPHYWIKAGKFIVDYRLRMWAGDEAPHGVFEPSRHPNVEYDGHPIEMSVSSTLFQILLEPPRFKKEV